jgi:hypothetical protein
MRTNLKSFNGGFISREAEARTDINSYQKSCRDLYNMIPSIVGSVHKRVGTKYITDWVNFSLNSEATNTTKNSINPTESIEISVISLI